MLITYIIILLCVVFANNYSAYHLSTLDDYTIRDIGFTILPYYDNTLNDYIVIGLILAYLLFGKNYTQLLKLSIILFTLRVIFNNLTVLPVTSDECKKKTFLPFTGRCRDLVFSGHTSLAVLIVLFLIHENTISTLVGTGTIVTLITSILLARHHYTLDVVIGALVSMWLFHSRNQIHI